MSYVDPFYLSKRALGKVVKPLNVSKTRSADQDTRESPKKEILKIADCPAQPLVFDTPVNH